MTTESVCRHEAGHAVSASLMGLTVRLIDTVPRTERTPAGGLCEVMGEVRHSGEEITDHLSAFKRMITILAGPIEGAESWDDVPSWPLNPDASTDEHNLHALADWLGLDEDGYADVFVAALRLTTTDRYRMLFTAVTGLLDFVPRIDAATFEQVREIARRR